MAKQRYDFKKEWPRIRTQLNQLSKEAMDLAKKGEKELVRFSRRGKLHLDTTAINLKREHLFHLIGKEYVDSGFSGTQTAKMKKLLADLTRINREAQALKRRMRSTRRKVGQTRKRAKRA